MKTLKMRVSLLVVFFAVGIFSFTSKGNAAAPIITAGNISVSGATGNGGVFITHNAELDSEDVMKVQWDNSSDGDNNSGVTGVTVDFSQLEGDSAVQAFDDGGTDDDSCDQTAADGIWTACYYLGRGTFDGVIGKVSVTATNNDGSVTTEDDTDLTIDNVPPVVETTVDTYGTDAATFSFGGTTSSGSKVYYEIWDYGYSLFKSDYVVGQPADVNGDYSISSVDISGLADGSFSLYVWVQDSAGNYAASFYDAKPFIKTGSTIGVDKTNLTATINSVYADEAERTTYNLTDFYYTSESWAVYVDAIAAAIVVEDDADATPTEVADAISAIELAEANLELKAQVATPVASLASGTYFSNQQVTLSSTTPGATIYYTLDGQTTPTASSILYTGPITISEGTPTPLKAIAIKNDLIDSAIMSMAYEVLTTARGLDSFSSSDILNDISHSFISIEGENPEAASRATFNVGYVVQSANNAVTIPAGTEMTKTGGGSINLTALINQAVSIDGAAGALKFGILNQRLSFSKPIVISINVGEQNNGKTLNVYYQHDGDVAWNQESTCVVANSVCVFSVSHATYFAAGEKAPGASVGSSKSKKKEEPKKREIKNSQKKVKNGDVLKQSGKRFSKNSDVALYFAKYGGGYYEPMIVKTNKSGSFSISYKVNKQAGTYGWYAVDKKTGKKSKTIYYRVK